MLEIIEFYASKFKQDAYYKCFDLANLLILLKDHNIFTEENVAKIKNIDPDDLWLTTDIVQDFIKENILNEGNFNLVITCKDLELRTIKEKILLKHRTLQTKNFVQPSHEIASTSFETSTSPLEKTKTSTSLQSSIKSIVTPQEYNSQTLADQRKLNTRSFQETIKNLSPQENSKNLYTTPTTLLKQTPTSHSQQNKNDSGLPPLENIEPLTGDKTLKASNAHKNLDKKTPLKTNLVAPLELKEGMISTSLINLRL